MVKTSRLPAFLTIVLCLVASPVVAATFTVNSPVDVNDANPGNGICETAPGNATCTLRAAIQEANALVGDDIINLPALPAPNAYVLEIQDLLIISSNLTITGGGAVTTIIDGNKAVRTSSGVIFIDPGTTVTISAVTIRNGARNILFGATGGGIANSGTLALSDSTVSGNSSGNIFIDGNGGGIQNTGSLTITNCTVSGNAANGFGSGGGIANVGVLTVTGSTVSGNTAIEGGGVYNGGTLTLNDSTLSGNTSIAGNPDIGGGGGVFNINGTVTLINSTASGNTSNASAGGIYNFSGTTTLINSTMSGNNAGGSGGGFRNGGTANLFNVTITNNTSNLNETGDTGAGIGGGVFNNAGATFNFRNTIILDNFDNAGFFGAFPNQCKGTITSSGNNVMGTTSFGCTVNGGGVTFVDSFAGPYLGPLQDNGGPTQTHALLANNPALNGGNPLGCRDQFGALLTTDQRGFPRPSPGTNCDAGAFESHAVLCPANSLQAAIDSAVAGQVILVIGTCSENLIVRNEKQRITIDGAGGGTGTRATITGNSTSPAVNIRGKGILLQNFTITGGSDGVYVNRGSNAVLNNNIIQNSAGTGVLVDELAFAVLTANTVQNHPEAGIMIAENSTARIGFNSDADTVASANTILFNGVGIHVANGSSARIVGNSVGGSTGDGIHVARDSHADISGNLLNGNADGIEVRENSTIQLGEDAGTSIFEAANSTNVTANTGVAVRCTTGGIADGRLGSLIGSGGTKNFAATCIDSLTP